MSVLKHHLLHHRKHMLGCVGGAAMVLLGGLFDQSVVAIAGAVVCGAFCADMVRLMVVGPRGG
jgi:hypothetical protein